MLELLNWIAELLINELDYWKENDWIVEVYWLTYTSIFCFYWKMCYLAKPYIRLGLRLKVCQKLKKKYWAIELLNGIIDK